MFVVHIPYRKWHVKGKVFKDTIAEVNEYMWEILPELIEDEHIIIEYVSSPKKQIKLT